MTFRVSEVYASVQGEGPNVGLATVFLRFGGCNLRCPGWPCDTQHAIDPAYRKEWARTSPSDLAEQVIGTAELAGAKIVTLTGGEPFLQRGDDLEELCQQLSDSGYRLEAFTNGTLLYPEWAVENISMIMDWKLPGSGEDPYNEVRYRNIQTLDESSIWHSVKFVCKDESDFHYARSLWSLLPERTRESLNWFYGRVWDGNISDAELVKLVLGYQLPWRLNIQTHNHIWPAHERAR